MKATQLFGRLLRSTHDYIGWIFEFDGEVANLVMLGIADSYHVSEMNDCALEAMKKVHSFTSLPIDKRWFERPPEPKEDDYIRRGKTVEQFEDDYKAYQNWTPLLEGDWEIRPVNAVDGLAHMILLDGKKVCFLEDMKNLNIFITHCTEKEIELVINPEFEIR